VSLSLKIRLRPVRFAFIVRPENRAKLAEVFRVTTCLWGGKYNPIVPFFKKVPDWWDRRGHRFENAKQIVDGYLDFFEPDILVETEKGIANSFGFDEQRVIQLSDVLERQGDGEDRGYGLSVVDVYRELYQKEFQFVHRKKPKIVNVKAKKNPFNLFGSCVFGAFPTTTTLEYFEQNYRDVFDPENINLTPKSFLSLYKTGCVTPLRIGQMNIRVRYHEHSDLTLFVLDADEPRDLIDYWNLRATHRQVLPIPVQWLKILSPYCKSVINKNYRPLPGNPHRVMIRTTVMFSRSIPESEIDPLFRKHVAPDDVNAVVIQTWYPPIWRTTPDFSARTTRPTLETSEKSLSLNPDPKNKAIRFGTLSPEFCNRFGGEFRWANVINLSDWSAGDEIATTFPCNYRNPQFPPFGMALQSVLPTTEGLVLLSKYVSSDEYWELIDGTNAINSWFKANKISATLSDGGRPTQQIIQTLGGFWGVTRIAHPEIVKLLNQMSRRPISRSMQQAEFKNRVNNAVANDRWRRKVFETLVERKVVALGLELRCTKCASWSWYSVDQLDYVLKCELCLKDFDFPITSPTETSKARWAYRVIGPFSLPDFARGGYAAALAIRFFADVLGGANRASTTWSSGQELELPSGKKSEADFILWHQRKQLLGIDYPTEIVFGEAKSFGKEAFGKDDIERMRLLADTFPGAVLVFATMKQAEDLSQTEIDLIGGLAKWGREYNRNRSQIRAPVILLTGTELFAAHSLDETWREKGGKHAIFVENAMHPIEVLTNLADCTQQLYLGMPSYGQWLNDKWKKRSIRRASKAKTSGDKE